MTVAPARLAAFEVLLRVFEEGAYADRALPSAASGLDERDRALAQRLAYGSVQRVRTLDHAIEMLGRRPVRKLDPPVRAALRLGAYQLGFLEGVPRYAAVNESVELVRRARLERAVPFTNAVLRRLADGNQAAARRAAGGDAGRGGAPPLLPGLGGRDMVGATSARKVRERACGRRTSRPRRSSASFVAMSTVRLDPEIPGRAGMSSASTRRLSREGRIWPQSRGSQLAGLAVGVA